MVMDMDTVICCLYVDTDMDVDTVYVRVHVRSMPMYVSAFISIFIISTYPCPYQ
jgi:hypothetical protein